MDKAFTTKIKISVTGNDSGRRWDVVSHKNCSQDADEMRKYVSAVVGAAMGASFQALADGVANGDVGKP